MVGEGLPNTNRLELELELERARELELELEESNRLELEESKGNRLELELEQRELELEQRELELEQPELEQRNRKSPRAVLNLARKRLSSSSYLSTPSSPSSLSAQT